MSLPCGASCQAAQALQNVDNSLELACQWLLAAASRSDDDGTPGGTRVGALPRLLPSLHSSAPCTGCPPGLCHEGGSWRALGCPRCVAPDCCWFNGILQGAQEAHPAGDAMETSGSEGGDAGADGRHHKPCLRVHCIVCLQTRLHYGWCCWDVWGVLLQVC